MSDCSRWHCILVVVSALFVAAGCGKEPGVFAKVGGESLNLEALQHYLSAVSGREWQDVEGAVASRLFDQYLDQEVVAAAAASLGKPPLPSEPGSRTAEVRSLLGELCGSHPAIDEKAVKIEVDRRLLTIRPARAHVRQMLLENLEQATLVCQRLSDEEDFVELSQQVSRTPNAAGGGELGFIEQGTLPEELDEVIFALAEGEISDPVQGPTGYHIFQVLERIGEGPPLREDLRRAVALELSDVEARKYSKDCVRRLATEVGVEVYFDHLWFEYGGRYGGEDT